MKTRDSGMPEQEMWEKFFDTGKILSALRINKSIKNAAEFGCGYGTFTIPVARVISGQIYAIDIEPEMVRMTSERTTKESLKNIHVLLRDFVADGSGLPDESIDYVMMFNILHMETPDNLLKEAKRILKPGGRAGVIHWNYDPSTPRGPAMVIRPKPGDIKTWALDVGFKVSEQYDLKPYHYGMILTK